MLLTKIDLLQNKVMVQFHIQSVKFEFFDTPTKYA